MKTQKQIAGMSLFEIEKLVKDRDYWIVEGRAEALAEVNEIVKRIDGECIIACRGWFELKSKLKQLEGKSLVENK